MKIKPFQQQGHFTIFDNVILDYILPRISGSEWKILSVIIRKTVGWHKEQDELSFSQLRQITGIRSDATVARSLATLEQAGYIRVDRSDEKWTSNIYALNLDFEIEVDAIATEIEGDPSTSFFDAASKIVAGLTTKIVVEPATENEAGSTTKNEDTKEREKEKEKKRKKGGADAPKTQKKLTPAQEMFGALAEVCKYDLTLITEKERGQLNQAEKKLREKNFTPADLTAFSVWWYEYDWRGQKGQPPTLSDIRQTWGRFRDYQKNGLSNGGAKNGQTRRSNIKGLRENGADEPIKARFNTTTGEEYYVDVRTGERIHPTGCPCYECQPGNRAEYERLNAGS